MRFRVYEEMREGCRTVVLADREADASAVVVPDIGGNMIRCRLAGRETIAGPPDLATLRARSAEYGVPLLCPPGRISGGTFAFRGRTYAYPLNDGEYHLHGEIRNLSWRIVKMDAHERDGASVTLEFRFERHPQLFAYYPHRMELRLTYRLYGDRLAGVLEAVNRDEEEAPFGFGLHPYFAIPEQTERVRIKAPAALQYDTDIRPGERTAEKPGYTDLCAQLAEGLRLDRLPADVDHFVFKTNSAQESVCRLTYLHDGVELQFQFDGKFPFLAVFKPVWADALSLEPWSCISDAFNLPLPEEWTGAGGLKPGERREYRWSWQLRPAADEIQPERGDREK